MACRTGIPLNILLEVYWPLPGMTSPLLSFKVLGSFYLQMKRKCCLRGLTTYLHRLELLSPSLVACSIPCNDPSCDETSTTILSHWSLPSSGLEVVWFQDPCDLPLVGCLYFSSWGGGDCFPFAWDGRLRLHASCSCATGCFSFWDASPSDLYEFLGM